MQVDTKSTFTVGIIEDEFLTAEFVKREAVKNGYSVLFVVDNAIDAKEKIKISMPDILFVDINIRGAIDGIMLVKELQKREKIPLVVYISAYNDELTIKELSSTLPGGFLKKPFNGDDIRVMLTILSEKISSSSAKKVEQSTEKGRVAVAEGYVFDMENIELLFRNNNTIDLTLKERKLLKLLARKINFTVSKDEFIAEVWDGEEVSSSTIRDLVYKIRKKIEGIDIKTVSSYGYSLKSPTRER